MFKKKKKKEIFLVTQCIIYQIIQLDKTEFHSGTQTVDI